MTAGRWGEQVRARWNWAILAMWGFRLALADKQAEGEDFL